MRLAMDTALRGILGLVIVAGMLGALWLAHGISARAVPEAASSTTGVAQRIHPGARPRDAGPARGRLLALSDVRDAHTAPGATDAAATTLGSARVARDPVQRTAIPPSLLMNFAPQEAPPRVARAVPGQRPPLAAEVTDSSRRNRPL